MYIVIALCTVRSNELKIQSFVIRFFAVSHDFSIRYCTLRKVIFFPNQMCLQLKSKNVRTASAMTGIFGPRVKKQLYIPVIVVYK